VSQNYLKQFKVTVDLNPVQYINPLKDGTCEPWVCCTSPGNAISAAGGWGRCAAQVIFVAVWQTLSLMKSHILLPVLFYCLFLGQRSQHSEVRLTLNNNGRSHFNSLKEGGNV